jgi:hypothetical protein
VQDLPDRTLSTTHRHTTRILFLAAVNAGAMLAVNLDARAGSVTWANPGTAGTWIDPSNWSGGTVPANGDDALLTQSDGVNRTVRYMNPAGVNLKALQINSTGTGIMTLRHTQDPLNALDFVVGVTAAGAYELSGGTLSTFRARIGNKGAGTATQSGGLLSAPQFVSLGDEASGSGRYSLSGSGVINTVEFDVGYFGAGTMEQSGGTVTLSGGTESFLGLGVQAGGRGIYNLTTSGMLAAPSAYVGLLGSGSLVQTAGSVSIASVLSLGENAGAAGNYTIGGSGALSAGQIDIGYEGAGSFTQSGNATVTAGAINVGGVSGGAGEYLQNGGTLAAGELTVASDGGSGGTFKQSRGAASVTTVNVAYLSGSQGSYVVDGGKLAAANVNVGGTTTDAGGAASFTINGGSVDVSGRLKLWSAGTVRFNGGDLHAASLDAEGGRLVAGPGSAVVVRADAVSINAGHIDLNDNAMIVDYSPAGPSPRGVPGTPDTIADYIAQGFHAGAWDGPGIATSLGTIHMGLGYGEASDVLSIAGAQTGTFMGKTVDASSVLVRYTFFGDANLDGIVDTLDFNALAGNFGGTSKAWSQADFNYDSVVDTLDFNSFAANFGHSVSVGAPSSALALVPEPTVTTFLLVSFLIAGARRRGGDNGHPGIMST